ncbi:hypothetical protein [Acidipila sp. EB88]|uniref:hypothetical protein n=1 Tax=Acidipila sp. EB88 TaxID=2305226 RepID=UPI000F600987|nr:hypothetical protein [Acidipila sp. EB88]RRA47434.1 hypothetical protein D1Y84_03115 [Acidipila sp. EB88]
MTREEMIAAIEGEITRLEQVRELLRNSTSDRFTAAEGAAPGAKKPRVLSADARRRIAQAQKRRWAKQRKETAQAAAEAR